MSGVAVFKSPHDVAKTQQIVASVIKYLKGSYKGNTGKWNAHDLWTVGRKKFRFFYGATKDGTAVRVLLDSAMPRRAWRSFIWALNKLYGNRFGLDDTLDYKPVAVLTMENQRRQLYTSKTSGGTSLAGFLLGGAAFGEAGAIVGGLSGTQRTYGEIREYDNGLVDVEILWSDGCIIKETISKNTNFYNEILMMNLE